MRRSGTGRRCADAWFHQGSVCGIEQAQEVA